MFKKILLVGGTFIALESTLNATGDIDRFIETRNFSDFNGEKSGNTESYSIAESLFQRDNTPGDTDANRTNTRNALKIPF